jgi:hypothetical protein
LQKFNQRPVDVAEAEQAEVNGLHVCEPENIPSAGTICSRPWKAGVNIKEGVREASFLVQRISVDDHLRVQSSKGHAPKSIRNAVRAC